MVLAHILRKQPCKVAVSPRMVGRQKEHSLGRIALLIRPEAHPRQSNLLAHVVFAHEEIANTHTTTVFNDQVNRRILRRNATLLRNRGERLTGQWLQLRVLERQQQDTLRASRTV